MREKVGNEPQIRERIKALNEEIERLLASIKFNDEKIKTDKS